jgi:hypothetical protein
MIGYGILIFVIGFCSGQIVHTYLLAFIPIGSLITFTGAFFFLRMTDLNEEFTMNKNEDLLTYFWNVIALKLWTSIFMLWMLIMNIILFTDGKI